MKLTFGNKILSVLIPFLFFGNTDMPQLLPVLQTQYLKHIVGVQEVSIF